MIRHWKSIQVKWTFIWWHFHTWSTIINTFFTGLLQSHPKVPYLLVISTCFKIRRRTVNVWYYKSKLALCFTEQGCLKQKEGYSGGSLTKLLNGSVSTPWQFECDMNTSSLVQCSPVSLEWDSWTSSFWDNRNVLKSFKNIYIRIF